MLQEHNLIQLEDASGNTLYPITKINHILYEGLDIEGTFLEDVYKNLSLLSTSTQIANTKVANVEKSIKEILSKIEDITKDIVKIKSDIEEIKEYIDYSDEDYSY